MAATDIAADGSVEIAHGLADGGGVLITDQTGAGISLSSLGIQEVPPYSHDGFLALGDVNGDGVADVVSTTEDFATGFSQVVVSMANSAPPIAETVIEQLTFPSGGAMVVCDFDGDGVDDIIVAPSFTMYSGKKGTISLVPGAPAFFQTGDKLACGDLNGDGFEDLVIGFPEQGGLGDFEVISAQGAPGGTPTNFFTGTNSPIALSTSDDIAAGDLDGDGIAELVVAHQTLDSSINIFSAPGKTPPPPPVFEGFAEESRVAVPKHTKAIPPTTTGTITVPYIVTTILYVPPGDKSVTDNIKGTTLGSSETMTFTTTEGGSVGLNFSSGKDPATMVAAVSGDLKTTVTFSQINTTTHAFATTVTSETLYSPPAGQDVPDHRFDAYMIDFNVKGTVTDTHNGQPPTVTLDMTSGTLITGFLAGFLQEIKDSQPLTIEDPNVKAMVTGAIDTPAKAAGLLALDPFFTGEDITQEPTRFVPFIPDGQSDNVVQLSGPLGSLDGGTPMPVLTKLTGSRATTVTQGTGSGMTITVNGDVTLFGVVSLGGSYSINYTDVTSTSTTTTTADSITLGTDHLCESGPVSLYQDLLFGGSFLTLQTLSNPCKTAMDALSFEALADWQVQDGGAATLSSVSASGASSLSVTAAPGGWTPIVSTPFASSVLRQVAVSSDLSKVSFALNIPTTQPNPYWVGDAQMFISSPNANVFNVPLGEVDLTGLPEGQFNRIEFTIPSVGLPALTGDNSDVTFTIVLNINPGTSGWLVDDLQIGS